MQCVVSTAFPTMRTGTVLPLARPPATRVPGHQRRVSSTSTRPESFSRPGRTRIGEVAVASTTPPVRADLERRSSPKSTRHLTRYGKPGPRRTQEHQANCPGQEVSFAISPVGRAAAAPARPNHTAATRAAAHYQHWRDRPFFAGADEDGDLPGASSVGCGAAAGLFEWACSPIVDSATKGAFHRRVAAGERGLHLLRSGGHGGGRCGVGSSSITSACRRGSVPAGAAGGQV